MRITAAEFGLSNLYVWEAQSIELEELKSRNCGGASSAHSLDVDDEGP